jgi:outer membrane protein assembly factor BamD (BamD/ComL family)
MEQKEAVASTGSIDLAQQEVALTLFWDKHKKTVFQIFFGILAIGLVFWVVKMYQLQNERDARKILIEAKDDSAYKVIIDKFPATSSAAESLTYLGKKSFEEKKYAEAAGYYDAFLKQFPDHALSSVVAYSYGLSLQYDGKVEEAKKVFQQNITDTDRKAVAGGSVLQLVEIYRKENKPNEAISLLENFKRQNPQSAFIPNIDFALGQLQQK